MTSPAQQARAMGLKVGDTIEGVPVDWDSPCTVRLTLKYLGKYVAVWDERILEAGHKKWPEPDETADWELRHMEWKKISGAENNRAATANAALVEILREVDSGEFALEWLDTDLLARLKSALLPAIDATVKL